jgi:hypothetical protein
MLLNLDRYLGSAAMRPDADEQASRHEFSSALQFAHVEFQRLDRSSLGCLAARS